MPLTRSLVAGPVVPGSGFLRRVDVAGHCLTGSRAPWTFETLAGGVASIPRPAEAPPLELPAWRIAPGFGVTEAGCVLVGMALALARTPGADDVGAAMIRRRNLDPRHEVLVVPDVVRSATKIGDLPLAVVLTALEDATALIAELDATTTWTITRATPRR